METVVVVDDTGVVVEESGRDGGEVEALLVAAAVEEEEPAPGRSDVEAAVVDGDTEGMMVEDAGEKSAAVVDDKAEVEEVEATAKDDGKVETIADGALEAVDEDAAALEPGDGVGAGAG